MPEAITKFAINSSLGNSDFVPIDVLIKGYRHLIPSENMLFNANIIKGSFNENDIGNKTNISNIKFLISGNVKIGGHIFVRGASAYHPRFIFEIQKNGEIIYSTDDFDAYMGVNDDFYITTDVNINDNISFYFTPLGNIGYEYPLYVQEVNVKGEISDIPIFDV